MTPEEAISKIKAHMEIHKLREAQAVHITEALNMAIEALTEVQWYRKVGTVAECMKAIEGRGPIPVENTKVDPEPEYVEIVSKDGIENDYKVGEVCEIIDKSTEGYKLLSVANKLVQLVSKTDTKPLKAVKRIAKPGEYIMLVRYNNFSFDDIGNIMKATITDEAWVECDSRDFAFSQKEPHKGLWTYLHEKYVVLEDYEPPKKFVPHLEAIYDGENYGPIGEKTTMRDVFGNELFVGDKVMIISQKDPIERDYSLIGKLDERDKKYIILGCRDYEPDNVIIVKVKSYEELNHGDCYDGVRAVLKKGMSDE